MLDASGPAVGSAERVVVFVDAGVCALSAESARSVAVVSERLKIEYQGKKNV